MARCRWTDIVSRDYIILFNKRRPDHQASALPWVVAGRHRGHGLIPYFVGVYF